MKKLRKLDFSDFYYCAEQKFVSVVTSLFKNPVRSGLSSFIACDKKVLLKTERKKIPSLLQCSTMVDIVKRLSILHILLVGLDDDSKFFNEIFR